MTKPLNQNRMLKRIRLALSLIFFTAITLLFLDFTGTIHAWLGWTAKIQFIPALLSANLLITALLIAATLVFGRIYCSIICPLGVLQDIAGWFGKKQKTNRYSYSPAIKWARWGILALFAAAVIASIGPLIALLDPYAAYGRIAGNIFAPIWQSANNMLAWIAERQDSYAFYETSVWIKSLPAFTLSLATLAIIGFLAWRNGRTYCNVICPVGTILGFIARIAWLKPVIETSKCINCRKCERRCKASCINVEKHEIDYSRCVACMDCIEQCNSHAITYRSKHKGNTAVVGGQTKEKGKTDDSRRRFLTTTAMIATTAAVKAQEMKVDGGLAIIEDKKIPNRAAPIIPPGARSASDFFRRCTGCQLCVSTCPNEVLRPSAKLATLLQPVMSYERGYCRPECTRCSEVCPAGAILPITAAEKSSIQIGHAVWVKNNCVPLSDGVECGNCARHCPTGAIVMIAPQDSNNAAPKIPAINTERCIGCGACENLCPARPFTAIYVEGNEMHRTI